MEKKTAGCISLILCMMLLLTGCKDEIVSNITKAIQEEFQEEENEEESSDDEQEVQDEQEDSEIDMSLVDIDAVSNEYVELSGCVTLNGDDLCLQLEEALNFYVYDPQQSENVLVQGVDQPYLSSDSTLSLAEYEGRTITAGGEVSLDDGSIVFTADNLIDAEAEEDDTGIHQYEFVIEDCTWYDALTGCAEQGGYLARISSPEEYQYIISMINSKGYTNIHFYLGGRRDDTGSEYYWVNEQNEFIGDCLNSSDSWCSSYWYQNEPSFTDTGSDAAGEIAENVMNLFYVSGSWYLNDSSDDLAGNYPDLLSGKVGYIIEYEE